MRRSRRSSRGPLRRLRSRVDTCWGCGRCGRARTRSTRWVVGVVEAHRVEEEGLEVGKEKKLCYLWVRFEPSSVYNFSNSRAKS